MIKRLPELRDILQVYAVIAVMFSGWTILAFLWKLPAWLLLLNLGEILTIFAYAMTANLLETLAVLFTLLLLCFFLPSRFLREDFAVRGSILAIGLIGSLMAFVGVHLQTGIKNGPLLFAGPLLAIFLTMGVLWLVSSSRHGSPLRSGVLWISDRLTVFLVILLPLFVVLSAYVFYRNLG